MMIESLENGAQVDITLYSRLYPTKAPIARARLTANTGDLFPMKSEIKPWMVPPVTKPQNDKKSIFNVWIWDIFRSSLQLRYKQDLE